MIKSVDWLVKNIDDPNLVLLDASLIAKKMRVIQIPGSRYFDLPGKFSNKESNYPNTMPSEHQFQSEARALGINNDSRIVIYDNMGIYSSPRVWYMFRSMGHKEVYVLDGGLPAWIDAGQPTKEIDVTIVDNGNFEAKANANAFKSFEEIETNIETEQFKVLDARSKGRFDGTSPEPRKELRSGHIPNSSSLPFSEVLDGGKFKSKEELEKIFSGDGPLVFTCGSGLTACITLLAAEIVSEDREKAVFDGSWTEWAMRNGLLT